MLAGEDHKVRPRLQSGALRIDPRQGRKVLAGHGARHGEQRGAVGVAQLTGQERTARPGLSRAAQRYARRDPVHPRLRIRPIGRDLHLGLIARRQHYRIRLQQRAPLCRDTGGIHLCP